MSLKKQTKRLTAAARRKQLIDIGRSIFAEKGYDATSVEEIAERAEISKPIVYEHFGGKEGLYNAVLDNEIEKILESNNEALEAAAADNYSPRKFIEAAVASYMNYIKNNSEGFIILYRDTPITGNFSGTSMMFTKISTVMESIFKDMLTRTGNDPSAAPIYAVSFMGMVTYVGIWWIKNQHVPLQSCTTFLCTMVWMGLRHLPDHPQLSIPLDFLREENS